jgi:hypothetical protein
MDEKQLQGTWKPRWYVVKVSSSGLIGATGENTVTLDARPFICHLITHAIEGAAKEYQHGDYSLQVRDDRTTYQNLPINANAMFGSVFDAQPIPLAKKILYKGSSTITVATQNLRDRTAEISGIWTLDVVLHGLERID